MPYKCFLLERTAEVRIDLRRYSSNSGPCPLVPGEYSYHDATFNNFLVIPAAIPAPGAYESYDEEQYRPPKDDPRWPTHCACGFAFPDSATWQLFSNRIYRRTDTGERMILREAPAGALYRADWYYRHDGSGLYGWDWDNQYEAPLICITPGGSSWDIDGRASNCTRKEDKTHRCWVRHGVPPDLHVDKNGDTCAAGAGSIIAGNYHGFLHNGYLTDGC